MFILRHSYKYHGISSFKDLSSKTFSSTVSEKLIDLGKDAFQGISEGKAIFTEQEIDGLQETGLPHSLQRNLFRFAHITMQEFLAAWYIVEGKGLKLKDTKRYSLITSRKENGNEFYSLLLDFWMTKACRLTCWKTCFPLWLRWKLYQPRMQTARTRDNVCRSVSHSRWNKT